MHASLTYGLYKKSGSAVHLYYSPVFTVFTDSGANMA